MAAAVALAHALRREDELCSDECCREVALVRRPEFPGVYRGGHLDTLSAVPPKISTSAEPPEPPE